MMLLRYRTKLVQASRSAEWKRPDYMGDCAPVAALRPDCRLPAELQRHRSGRVPAVPQATARRRPRSTGRPGASLSVGVWADDRRAGGAADRRRPPDGQNV